MLDRRQRLEGYELYMVEQWACSRVHPTFVITTFTGNPTHSVLASVLSVPTNEDTWSPRLRVYFKAVSQFHARPRETPLGMLMVTNLSGFPSALTVIAVPGGDIKAHREDFIVNENLKRLGCSGRAGMSLSAPTGATQAKFHHLYKTSDRISFYDSVIELVRLCQVALMLFGKLGPEYADGLLCDVTERGINDWWTDIGSDFYDTEPGDGILGPTTVAALLGLLMGARNRLNAYGAPVGKDAYDLAGLKRGIAYFQKSQKLPRTRRLDRPTHSKLCKATSKVASGEGWMVPKGVKSTVAELSGKGGDMVMGMVGARDKIGLAEVETMDFERFIQLAYGERAKWLWYGKPRRSMTHELFSPMSGDDNLMFGRNPGQGLSTRRRASVDIESPNIEMKADEEETGHRESGLVESSVGSESPLDCDLHLRKAVLKSVTGKMTDARSGFGRIKDAVGLPTLRGHHHRPSKDENSIDNPEDGAPSSIDKERGKSMSQARLARMSESESAARSEPEPPDVSSAKSNFEIPASRRESNSRVHHSSDDHQSQHLPGIANARMARQLSTSVASDDESLTQEDSHDVAIPRVDEVSVSPTSSLKAELSETILSREHAAIFTENNGCVPESGNLLRRTQSFPRFTTKLQERRNDAWWPRHLSFSDAQEAILTWEDINLPASETHTASFNLPDSFIKEEMLPRQARRRFDDLLAVEDQVGCWVRQKLQEVEGVHDEASRNREELSGIYHQRLEEYQRRQGSFTGQLGEERTQLTEAIRDVEILGAKLEYELNALGLKVDDVEDSVAEFERLVEDVETRAEALEASEQSSESWTQWGMRIIGRRTEQPRQ